MVGYLLGLIKHVYEADVLQVADCILGLWVWLIWAVGSYSGSICVWARLWFFVSITQ